MRISNYHFAVDVPDEFGGRDGAGRRAVDADDIFEGIARVAAIDVRAVVGQICESEGRSEH